MAYKRKIELETKSRSILDGYFNPLVFCYQWDYLRSPAKNLSLFTGYLRLALLFIGGFYIPS